MYGKLTHLVLTLLATRPIWGFIPIRLGYGIILIKDYIPDIPEKTATVVGTLILLGFFSRFAAAAMVLSMLPALFGEGGNAAYVLLFVTSLMFTFSGGGRFSLDRYISCTLLKIHPNTKKEMYVLAETPYTEKWYE